MIAISWPRACIMEPSSRTSITPQSPPSKVDLIGMTLGSRCEFVMMRHDGRYMYIEVTVVVLAVPRSKKVNLETASCPNRDDVDLSIHASSDLHTALAFVQVHFKYTAIPTLPFRIIHPLRLRFHFHSTPKHLRTSHHHHRPPP